MHHRAKGLCLLAMIALIAAPALSGCSNSEPTAAQALVHSGVFGGLLDGLKREDDEAELREIREAEPQTPQERDEAREREERAALEAEPPAQPGGG